MSINVSRANQLSLEKRKMPLFNTILQEIYVIHLSKNFERIFEIGHRASLQQQLQHIPQLFVKSFDTDLGWGRQ